MRITSLDSTRRPPRAVFHLVLLASLWLTTLGNLALWRTLFQLPDLIGWHGALFGIALALIIASALTGFLALFAWRWTLKPAISALLLLAAISTYYLLMYGIVVDTPMMINVIQTDSREVSDQLSWRLGITVLGLAVLPMVWLWRQTVTSATFTRQVLRNAGICLLAMTVSLGLTQLMFQDFASLMRNHTQLRYLINPLNSVYALLDVTVFPQGQPKGPIQALGEDAHISPRAGAAQHPPLLLFVLGETARSANFSLNGYARLTNPLLAKENLTSFTDVTACGTSTAESVPCMFSHLGREGFAKRSHDFENWLDVLHRAGYAVLWMDNQSGCKDQCNRIPHLNTSKLELPDECNDGECRDTVMLAQIDQALAQLPAERRARGTVVVMHQMGSHGPAYFKRTPAAFKAFLPECTHSSLSPCSRAQIINAYDNTLVFTDYFLSRAIGWLKGKEKFATPALFYVADHGESLGENNLYLHGLPYAMAPKEQKQVPLITWLSPRFEMQSRIQTSCLQKQRDRALSHDHVFHSVLGLMAVKTEAYQPAQDLFANCAKR